jgi:beta-galactosidase
MKSRMRNVLFPAAILFLIGSRLSGQELYVGVNYHPHDDKDPVKIARDVRLMREAGFKVVRMGHLAWDSYEPSEGRFDFEWFDHVMDRMSEAGIKVVLDIAIRPAPIWLHQKYPSIGIVDANGDAQYPNHRYMEDVGDPDYQRFALRFAETIAKRYGSHPALLAFGIDNESGDGRISYSETARQRFIGWLKRKYTTVGRLNEAWATQRWSRRLNQFEEVGFPVSTHFNDVPERMLDFRRFVSDEINQLLFSVIRRVNAEAPGALITTNAWYYSGMKYFDYAPIAYSGLMTREGNGFYAGTSLLNNEGILWASFGIVRIQYESENPFWCNEFTTMTAVPGSCRKQAYASLMFGNQMVCGWTWQSMHSGEEQYLQGLIDWDGVPNRKYDEYRKIASEFRKIEKFLPYKPRPEAGLAFSFPSQIVSASYPESHESQVGTCFKQFYDRNMDVRMVDIRRSDLNYKLLMIPGVTVMDPETAGRIRDFVKKGGTAVMTSYSAVVDTTSRVFASTRPGLLADVFGVRIGGYEEVENMNELSRHSYQGKKVRVRYRGKDLESESPRYDVLSPRGADVIGKITSLDQDIPVITSNRYGNGRAIYVGLPARGEILSPLLDDLIEDLSLKKGPDAPAGVMARQIDEKHVLYLNCTGEPKEIRMKAPSRSLLFDRTLPTQFVIPPYEPEFIEIHQ